MKGSINTLHQKLPLSLAEDMDNFVRSEIRITPAPRRRHSGYVVKSKYPWAPKSPSTDSTTSLAQLHEKLNALPPLIYNKVPQKISATPELATVREVSENDDLSNTLSSRNRLGVARHYKSMAKANLSLSKKIAPSLKTSDDKISIATKPVQGYKSENESRTPLVERPLRAYQSDTETKTVVKKSRCISPVNKENSASLLLVATLGTSDESVINDTYDKLRKDNPEYDLLELLMEEALQNDQEKDSGVCSKRTQESDVVENTPIETNVERKKRNNRAKQTVVNNTTTDESTTDVIDDTPCYVYDRKKRAETNTKKSSSVITEDVSTFDAAAVDTFFSQHMTENNGSFYISPTLAKKINATSSESSEGDLADFTIFQEQYINVIPIVEEVVDKDIVDCLNSMLDKVCSDLDKCIDLMNEKHQHVEVLTKVQHFDESSSVTSDFSKTKNISCVDDFDKTSDDTKKVTLKFNFSKKRAPKIKKKQPKKYKTSIKSNETVTDTKVKSPERKPILTRKKRKLYSPKDSDSNMNEITRTTQKDESRQSIINKTPIATCYKELEKARKSRIRLPRKSRASTEPLTSPKTKKLNDLFDKLKDNVENAEEVTLADRPKSRYNKDTTLYNLSSESEDQNFQEAKIKAQKRVNSSSLETSAKKRSRVTKTHQFSDYDYRDLTSEDESKMTKTRKMIKQPKSRSRKIKKEHNVTLIDEKMRQAPPEVLETSFIKETVTAKEADTVEPAIQEAPVLEIIPDDDVTEGNLLENQSLTPKEVEKPKLNKEKVINKKNEKTQNNVYVPNTSDIVKIKKEEGISQYKSQTPDTSDLVKIKKEKGVNKRNEKPERYLVTRRGKVANKLEVNKNKNLTKGRDSATVSPLPGLVVETEQLRKEDITSSLEANLLQKFKNIYTDAHDLSDTQNLLLAANNHNNTDGEASFTKHMETLEVSDNSTERSIATVGRSPITAHNDLDEVPPNVDLLQEQYQHRDVNIEDMSRDMAEFLDTMRSQFNCSKLAAVPQNTSPVLPMIRTPSKRSIKKQNTTSAESNATVPVVALKRLSTEEIETNLNAAVTPSRMSQISSSNVLSRKSSKEIESLQAKTSSSPRSLQVVLDKLSSDDINKWLPIPPLTSKVAINDKIPKKSKNKVTTKRLTGVTKSTTKIPETKCKSTITPKSNKIQDNKLKLIFSVTPDKPQENKIKSTISPVKLDFDWIEKPDRCVLKRYTARSSVRSTKSHVTKVENNKDEDVEDIVFCQKSSNTEATEKCVKEYDERKTLKSLSTINTTRIIRKDKTKRGAVESVVKITKSSDNSENTAKVRVKIANPSDNSENTARVRVKIANSSDNSENTARVQDWFQRNVSASTSGKADNAALKDIMAKVTEALETTLAEMHQSTREKLIHNYLENQKRFKAFKQDVCKRLDEMDKMLMEGANQVLREDAEKKALMVRLLQEDIQAAVDFVDKADK